MLRLDANEGRCILSEEDLREILSPEIARRYPMRELLGNTFSREARAAFILRACNRWSG